MSKSNNYLIHQIYAPLPYSVWTPQLHEIHIVRGIIHISNA